jgi:hypothetical protein
MHMTDDPKEKCFLPYDIEGALETARRLRSGEASPGEAEFERRLIALNCIHAPTPDYLSAREEFLLAVSARNAPDRQRELLLLSGAVKSGSSHILDRFARHRDLQPRWEDENYHRPLLKVRLSAGDRRKPFAFDMLESLNTTGPNSPPPATNYKGLSQDESFSVLTAGLRAQKVRIVLIDNVHLMRTFDGKLDIERIGETLAQLITDPYWPVHIVAAGRTDACESIGQSKELQGLMTRIELDAIPEAEMSRVAEFLDALEPQLGFRAPSNLAGNSVAFWRASGGRYGMIAQIAKKAAARAHAANAELIEAKFLNFAAPRSKQASPSLFTRVIEKVMGSSQT